MKKTLATMETLLKNKRKARKALNIGNTEGRFSLHDLVRKNRKKRIDGYK